MKRLSAIALLTTVSPLALFFVSPLAEAADLARKAPPPIVAPPPAYSWTGCYAGAHVGWGWGFNRHSYFSGTNAITGNQSLDTDGGLFGGQLGCRYQFAGWSPWQGGNWVVGVQGDFAGADLDGKGVIGSPFADNDDLVAVKTKWIASVTGSLGITTFNNQVLWYVKGGGAWARNQWDLSGVTHDFDNMGDVGQFSETRSGWTVGAGAEWTLWSPNWTAFVEWNYYQFNSGGSTTCGAIGCASDIFFSNRQEIQDIKVGVNYRFWGQ